MKTKRFLKILLLLVLPTIASLRVASEYQDILQANQDHPRLVALLPTKPPSDFRQFMESNPHASQALNFCLGITATFGAILFLKKLLDPEITGGEKQRKKK